MSGVFEVEHAPFGGEVERLGRRQVPLHAGHIGMRAFHGAGDVVPDDGARLAPSGRAVRRLWRCRKRRSRAGRAACRRWRYSWGALPGSRETRVQPSPSGFLPPPVSRVPAAGRSAAMAEPSTSTRPRKRPRAAASRSPPPPPTAGASSTQDRSPRAGASPSVSRRKTGTAPDRLPAPPRPAPPMTA